MGHRLSICKAIYNLKVELTMAAAEADPEDGLVGWDWTEEDWRPAGKFHRTEELMLHRAERTCCTLRPVQMKVSPIIGFRPTKLPNRPSPPIRRLKLKSRTPSHRPPSRSCR